MRAERAAIREQSQAQKAAIRWQRREKQIIKVDPVPAKPAHKCSSRKEAIRALYEGEQMLFPYRGNNQKTYLRSLLNLCMKVKNGELCDRMFTAVRTEEGILVRRIR